MFCMSCNVEYFTSSCLQCFCLCDVQTNGFMLVAYKVNCASLIIYYLQQEMFLLVALLLDMRYDPFEGK